MGFNLNKAVQKITGNVSSALDSTTNAIAKTLVAPVAAVAPVLGATNQVLRDNPELVAAGTQAGTAVASGGASLGVQQALGAGAGGFDLQSSLSSLLSRASDGPTASAPASVVAADQAGVSRLPSWLPWAAGAAAAVVLGLFLFFRRRKG